MSDHDAVRDHLDSLEPGQEMSDGAARTVASWWHNGGASVSYAFVSTGAITRSGSYVWADLTDDGRCYSTAGAFDRRALDYLGTYLVNAGERGPVDGWSDLWA